MGYMKIRALILGFEGGDHGAEMIVYNRRSCTSKWLL